MIVVVPEVGATTEPYAEVLKQLEDGYRLPCPKGVKSVLTWSPENLYENLSKVCFVADPIERAHFSDVVALIEKELSSEEILRYGEMTEKYQLVHANNYLRFGKR